MTQSSGVCYRHPKRESWVLCQRCGNTICGDCQRPAAVGFHCPDCVKAAAPATVKVVSGARLSRIVRGRVPATTGLLVAIGVVYLAQMLLGDVVTNLFAYIPALTWQEPWRLLTVALVHGGLLHILFNGYALWVVGNVVERSVGSAKFLVIFAVSTIAGSLAVYFLDPMGYVVGASGGIFGLFAAMFIINRSFRANNVSMIVVIGINLALGFIMPGVAWQAHVGGLIGGAIITALFLRKR